MPKSIQFSDRTASTSTHLNKGLDRLRAEWDPFDTLLAIIRTAEMSRNWRRIYNEDVQAVRITIHRRLGLGLIAVGYWTAKVGWNVHETLTRMASPIRAGPAPANSVSPPTRQALSRTFEFPLLA